MSKLTSVDAGTGSLRRKDGRERCFHIDDKPTAAANDSIISLRARPASSDPAIAMTASTTCLIIARDSGKLVRYSLPHISVEREYTLSCRAQTMFLNCDSTKLGVIDANGVLSLYDLTVPDGTPAEIASPPTGDGSPPAKFERKEVWDMKWAADDPNLFAIMEKTRMYIFDELVPEEPIVSSAYLCSFSQLQVRTLSLDQLIRSPEEASKDLVVIVEAKQLKEVSDARSEALPVPSTPDGGNARLENANLRRLLAQFLLAFSRVRHPFHSPKQNTNCLRCAKEGSASCYNTSRTPPFVPLVNVHLESRVSNACWCCSILA
eukprot:2041159-Pleurochrysis_carterae.AAC.2